MKRAAIIHALTTEWFKGLERSLCFGYRPTKGQQYYFAMMAKVESVAAAAGKAAECRRFRQREVVEMAHGDRPWWVRVDPFYLPPPRPEVKCGGRRRSLMAHSEEMVYLDELEKRAAQGEEITVADIAREIGQRVGHRVSHQAVIDILKRWGYVRVGVKPMWDRIHDVRRRRSLKARRAAAAAQAQPQPEPVVVDVPRSPPETGPAVSPMPAPTPVLPAAAAASEPSSRAGRLSDRRWSSAPA